MQDMIFIQDRNLFINLDMVIYADFKPAHEYVDDEFASFGQPVRTVQVDDKLSIVTMANEKAQEFGYEGEIKGVASQSQEIVLHGSSARWLFDLLKKRSNCFPADDPVGSLSATA